MPDIRDPDCIQHARKRWPAGREPKWFHIVEFYGDGDPFFGGTADDRPLGVSGRFLSKEESHLEESAVFFRLEEAVAAGRAASNIRPGSLIGLITHWQ